MRTALGRMALAFAVGTTAFAADPVGNCPAPEARQFDFWVGEWDVVNKGLGGDGSWRETGRARTKVYPILGGCAIVEHWRGTAWDGKTIGYSVRNWDPEKQKWTLLLSWPQKDRPSFGVLEGVFSHGRGEFFSEFKNQAGQDVLQRYSFSDATDHSLRWDAANSTDGGVNWRTYWIMEFTRRPENAVPVFNGPWIADGRERHCTQPEAAALDFLAGAWEGVERRRAGEQWVEHTARVSVVPILEGCALTEFVEVDDGAYGRYAVRAFHAGEQHWVQYEMDAGRPVFVRSTGTPDGDGIVFESEGRRTSFERTEDGRLVREDAVATADGSWNVEVRTELRPTFYGGRETARQTALRKLDEALAEGHDVAARRVDELEAEHPGLLNEALLNAIGYRMLQGGRTEQAVTLFEINAERHPQSANCHDSLAEAYRAAGRSNDSIAHYRKSLELDPQNENARKALEELERGG